MSKSNQELIEYFEKKFNKKIKNFNNQDWNDISESQDPYLSEDFIRECRHYVWWYGIGTTQNISGEFIEEFKLYFYRNTNTGLILSKHNKINWLKYKLEKNRITEKEYLKELLICQSQ